MMEQVCAAVPSVMEARRPRCRSKTGGVRRSLVAAGGLCSILPLVQKQIVLRIKGYRLHFESAASGAKERIKPQAAKEMEDAS